MSFLFELGKDQTPNRGTYEYTTTLSTYGTTGTFVHSFLHPFTCSANTPRVRQYPGNTLGTHVKKERSLSSWNFYSSEKGS